jgi:hypothetical protein
MVKNWRRILHPTHPTHPTPTRRPRALGGYGKATSRRVRRFLLNLGEVDLPESGPRSRLRNKKLVFTRRTRRLDAVLAGHGLQLAQLASGRRVWPRRIQAFGRGSQETLSSLKPTAGRVFFVFTRRTRRTRRRPC